MKYQINDVVTYGNLGVCNVDNIEMKDMGLGLTEYYVLRPVYDMKSTVFVPLNRENLVSKIKKLISKKEIDDIIDEVTEMECDWEENDKLRAEKWKNLMTTCDQKELLMSIKSIVTKRKDYDLSGKKLRATDEKHLFDAEKRLYLEIAYIVGSNYERVKNHIYEKLCI